MKGTIAAHSVRELLKTIAANSNLDTDLKQEIEISIFQKWRDGVELEPLFELLTAKAANERLQGAFYLVEAVPRHEGMIKVATKLATDPLSYCRKAFVGYMTDAGVFSTAIVTGLAGCLQDPNPFVRLETINWAVYTTDDRFEEFSLIVKSSPDAGKLGLRGLDIAQRLRESQSVDTIMAGSPEEDSLTFDYLHVFKNRLERYIAKRKTGASATTTNMPSRYDEFETGVLGEVYDNLGMLKGRLPEKAIPSWVTDEQLDDMIDRVKESSRQRKLDQRALAMAASE